MGIINPIEVNPVTLQRLIDATYAVLAENPDIKLTPKLELLEHIMTTNNTYNGWTNYATWRVNLEVFDGFDPYDYFSDDQASMIDWLPQALKDFAEEFIFNSTYDERGQTSLMEDYARAFLQEVNWHEIAKHMIAEYSR
jgi:hypothetical protein